MVCAHAELVEIRRCRIMAIQEAVAAVKRLHEKYERRPFIRHCSPQCDTLLFGALTHMLNRADFLGIPDTPSEDWSYATILSCIRDGQWSLNIRDIHIGCGFDCGNRKHIEGMLRSLEISVYGFTSTQVPNLRRFP